MYPEFINMRQNSNDTVCVNSKVLNSLFWRKIQIFSFKMPICHVVSLTETQIKMILMVEDLAEIRACKILDGFIVLSANV